MSQTTLIPAPLAALVILLGFQVADTAAQQAPVIIDSFDTVSGWQAHPADGVALEILPDEGLVGGALRLDFRFVTGGGYAVARKELAIDLPENYRIRFEIRGEAPNNTLEFKLIDESGENVWWHTKRDFEFPGDWRNLSIKKRQIEFAWGPRGGGEIRRAAAIEFAITAGNGGEGSVWIDELTLEALPPADATPPDPVVSASSFRTGQEPQAVLDEDPETFWWSDPDDRAPWLELDLGGAREFSGLVVDWEPNLGSGSYRVQISDDHQSWKTVRTVRSGDGGRDLLHVPEGEANHVRIQVDALDSRDGVAVRAVTLQPLDWAPSMREFIQVVARASSRGDYPRALLAEQTYWTVVGVDGGKKEALLNEDGLLESSKANFSIEPFVQFEGRLWTWADVRSEQSLEDGYLPIPSVRWSVGSLELTTSVFAVGRPDSSLLFATYRISNSSSLHHRGKLILAVRPLQVNPPWQSLNMPRATSPIHQLSYENGLVWINELPGIVCLNRPDDWGAMAFDAGNLVDVLRRGELTTLASSLRDPIALASGALSYSFEVPAGGEQIVSLLLPLDGQHRDLLPGNEEEVVQFVDLAREQCRTEWRKKLNRVDLDVPEPAREAFRTLKAQLAYILINRDGPSIQPGSRSYERSWIRDGSLTSTALLRLGHAEEVREFIRWFSGYQYENGKVPCCVDARGSDPVPEHDSHGEFIYLIAEYLRYTQDHEFAEDLWPAVIRAVDFLESLRQERLSSEFQQEEMSAFYGILPPSISHEGYSAKPMHSYWDDFFALRGYRDALYLAMELDRGAEVERLQRILDEFGSDLISSIETAMRIHEIDYIPGCADLGDFDATSTTIALSPTHAMSLLPSEAVIRTFDRYYEFFRDRQSGSLEWDSYTPYEIRNLGAFVRLGWRDRAMELLEYFLADRRPTGWAHWAEVVWKDPRVAKFLGDMPHTWVGSDYIRSLLDMIAYELEEEDAMVLGAGLPLSWLASDGGFSVRGLRTPYGRLDFAQSMQDELFETRIAGELRIPGGGLRLIPPTGVSSGSVSLNGKPVVPEPDGSVIVRETPARILIHP